MEADRKCPKCGLMNSAMDPACVLCGYAFMGEGEAVKVRSMEAALVRDMVLRGVCFGVGFSAVLAAANWLGYGHSRVPLLIGAGLLFATRPTRSGLEGYLMYAAGVLGGFVLFAIPAFIVLKFASFISANYRVSSLLW